jgi:2'-5' RNA ligase
MRVFVAADVPPEIRTALSEVQRTLRRFSRSARWVAADSIHITLKFIGEAADDRVADIDTALRGLAWTPFEASVRGIGFFPSGRSPRVCWAGLDAAPIAALAAEIDARLEAAGFENEKRPFRPHLTLARSRNQAIEEAVVTAASQYSRRDFGSFIVDRIFLFQSTLKPSGAVYGKLKEYAS